ncbi:aminopeptidase P family protein [Aggregicoccus sp. 17bor-14]|uniref:aminopeptidase P family protein n=1 Tax=Myxococcaceae TaxID=31 RepID=UPI00129CCA7F|nr:MULTISPECIES: aminopeptidase P family protein [Myxococcaceae]MBF5043413.1 aminopeptidase P family protein [Simulacricoccus sp. 17bor-14]MRI89171.1 aminopeptidase P family protein [Aggregicoccus sp. 17bor-14]
MLSLPTATTRLALQERRARLQGLLGRAPALLASGKPRARNYAAQQFPFRATSHFLYLFALPHPDALAYWDGEGWTLYLPPPAEDDALWEGSVPGFFEISQAVGVPVRERTQLATQLPAATATLPAPDMETNAELSRLLGREVRYGRLAAQDEKLADALIALRLRHDAEGAREMRLAADVTREAHAAGLAATRPGVTEAQVRAAMEAAILARNVEPAYSPIVTVHGEVLHNHHYGHTLQDGELLLADVGAESPGGWAGDVTRTWPVSGRFSTTQRALYDVVLRAQEATVAAVRPGARYRDLHQLAHRELTAGLVALGILVGEVDALVNDGVSALLFPHGVGHLIGLDVHDMEDLGDRAGYAPGRTRPQGFGHRYLRLDRDLEPGMCVTIEPGLYLVPAILDNPALTRRAGDRLNRQRLAEFGDVRGIRIEDDVLVTETGHEVLTGRIPKNPDIIESEMARR